MSDQTGVVQIPVMLKPDETFVLPVSRIFGDTYSIYGCDSSGLEISISDYQVYPSADSDAFQSALLPLLRVSLGSVSQILPLSKNSNNAGDNSLTFTTLAGLRNTASAELRITLDTTTLGRYLPMRYCVIPAGGGWGTVGQFGVNDVVYMDSDGTSIAAIQGSAAYLTLADAFDRAEAASVDFSVNGVFPESLVQSGDVALPAGYSSRINTGLPNPNPTAGTVRVGAPSMATVETANAYGVPLRWQVQDNTYPASAAPSTIVPTIVDFANSVVAVSGGQNIPSPAAVSIIAPRSGSYRPLCAMLLLRFTISTPTSE